MAVAQKGRSNHSGRTTVIYRIIPTVGKHIVAQDALSGGSKGSRIDKSTSFGVIISALEVVQTGLLEITIAVKLKISLFSAP